LTEASLKGCLQKPFSHVKFRASGTIKLSGYIAVADNVIIDGSGQSVTITGYGFHLKSNTIVYGLKFSKGTDDALTLRGKYQNAWVHKCSFSEYTDGLLDITEGYNFVTVSFCKFSQHDKTMLIGASEGSQPLDAGMKHTIHHNYFQGTTQRHPRVRSAYVHVYNNVYEDIKAYAIAASSTSRVLAERNYFLRGKTAFLTKAGEDVKSGSLRMAGNSFNPSTTLLKDVQLNPTGVPNPGYAYSADAADGALYQKVVARQVLSKTPSVNEDT